MGAREDTQQLVQAAADTARWIDTDTAEVVVDGRSCRVGLVQLRGAGPGAEGTYRTSGVEILVSLGQRPIRFDLGARGVTIPSLPTAPTGSAAFDERYVVQGIPADACAAAMDPDVQGWVAQYFGANPSLRTDDGDLRVFHQTVSDTPGWSTSPEALRSAIRWTLHVADRLVGEFDRRQAEIGRTSGQAAADQWLADVHTTIDRRDRRQTLIRVLVFGAVLLVPLLMIWLTFPGR